MKLLEDLYEQKEKKLFISFHHHSRIGVMVLGKKQ